MSQKQGIYFIANDQVMDLVIAFLSSLRVHNPSIPVCLIPFDKHYKKLLKLQPLFDFFVFEDQLLFDWCDSLSQKFIDHRLGHFRKIAAWEGPFEEFIYIDIDTVLLEDMSFVFQYLNDWDIVTTHSNMSHLIQYVWQGPVMSTGKLTQQQMEYSANTGFIVSRKGLLNREWIETRLDSALEMKPYMCSYTVEQPLLNYLIVISGLRYTSLLVIRQETQDFEIKLELWAGTKQLPNDGSQYFLVHWAGKWQAQPIDRYIHKVLKKLKLTDVDPLRMRYFMPYKKLWKSYRYLNAEAVTKALECNLATTHDI